MPDGQLCMIKETKELCLFVGNQNGDYIYDLGVIEDCFGYIKLVKLSDIEMIDEEEAKLLDPIMYSILRVATED